MQVDVSCHTQEMQHLRAVVGPCLSLRGWRFSVCICMHGRRLISILSIISIQEGVRAAMQQ